MAGRQVKAVGPSYNLADRKAACQRTVNLRMVRTEDDGEWILQDVDGWSVYLTLANDIRGVYSTGTRLFAVHAEKLVEITNGVASEVGELLTDSGYVSMKHNGSDQLGIVDGVHYYIFSLSDSTLTEIADGFQGSHDIDYADGYFIFVDPDTEQFYISAIDDGSDLDGLDFSSADRQPDNIVTHRVFKGELYFFGERSIEPWINTGGSDFPFARYNATPVEFGICGKRAVVTTNDSLVWVDPHGFVYSMTGYQPQRVSTQAIEELLQDAELSTCVVWTYQIAGAEFVGIEADGMETALVYDLATRQWHERATGNYAQWITPGIHSVVFHQGIHLAAVGAKLLLRNPTLKTFNGATIVRDRVWPHMVHPSLEPITYRSVELQCSTGYGGNCHLRISNDGGHTWGPALIKSLGPTGQWTARVRWHFLGSANDRVFGIGCSDAVPFSLYSATVDA